MAKKIFTAAEMSGGAKRSFTRGAMKKLMENKRIAKVLNTRGERREFFNELKKHGQGGVTIDEMRKVFGKFRSDGSDSLSAEETRIIAKETIKSGKRYIIPEKENKNPAHLNDNSMNKNIRNRNIKNAGIAPGINENAGGSHNGNNKKTKHVNIYDALIDRRREIENKNGE